MHPKNRGPGFGETNPGSLKLQGRALRAKTPRSLTSRGHLRLVRPSLTGRLAHALRCLGRWLTRAGKSLEQAAMPMYPKLTLAHPRRKTAARSADSEKHIGACLNAGEAYERDEVPHVLGDFD